MVKAIVENLGGRIEDLGYGYAIVTIPATNLVNLAQNKAIQYIEFPKSMILTDQGSNRAACVDKTRNTYSLSGEGIVIGFIDSGIDFTPVSYTHLTLPTKYNSCRSRWSPYH